MPPPPPLPLPPPLPTSPPVGFAQALRFWLKLGFISFGGPAGQIALMHEELVVRRRWIGERRFLHALNYCMLLPGPEAQQLATYLGWLMHRTAGGLAAGVLFVLPSLFILVALSWVYVRFGQVPQVAAVFWGLKPAVVALVAHAAWRLGRRTLHHRLLAAVALAAFVALTVFDVAFPWVVGAAALVGVLGARQWPAAFYPANVPPPGAAAAPGPTRAAQPSTTTAWSDESTTPMPAPWLADDAPPPPHAIPHRSRLWRVVAVALGLWAAAFAALALVWGAEGVYTRMAGFFTQAALVTFGGAYAVLPFVVQGAVETHGWLSPTQMIDGLALGETTPGPLIMVVAFVGFLGGWQKAVLGPEALFLAGAVGASVATFFTFLPSFAFILAGGPWVEASRGQLRLTAPLTAITAAVVGVIGHLAVFFAVHTFWPRGVPGGVDVAAAVLAVVAGWALMRWKMGPVKVLAACALAGLAWRGLGVG